MRGVALTLVLLAGCATLEPLEPGVCGNGVVDPGEDCDRNAPDGRRCGTPEEGARACRFVCDVGSCPQGWGCRPDDVCHHASGAFREVAEPVTFRAEEWSIADVDGDEVKDIIGFDRSSVRVLFGDGAGGFANEWVRALPPTTGRSAVGDIDGDGRADVAVPYREGMAFYLGRADRTLGAHPVATYRVEQPWMVPLQAAELGPSDALLGFMPSPGKVGMVRAQVNRIPVEVNEPGLFDFGDGTVFLDEGDLGTRLPVADLDGDGLDEFLLAVDDWHALLCETLPDGWGRTDNSISCEELNLGGRRVARGGSSMFADATGDGVLDAVVEVEDGVAVLEGFGIGLHDAVIDPWLTEIGMPLAAADVDGDGATDWVTREAIVRASEDEGDAISFDWLELGEPVVDAVAVRMRGRDEPHVVAVSTPSVVALVRLDETGHHVDDPIVTDGPPSLLRTGDFDGDGTEDLCFVERGAGATDTVVLVYGRYRGGVDEMVRLPGVPRIERLETGRLANRSDGPPDGLVDVLAESSAGEDGWYPLTIFEGTAGRDPIAPLALAIDYMPDVPGSALLGPFLGSGPPETDLVTIAQDVEAPETVRAWTSTAEPDARYRGDHTGFAAMPVTCAAWTAFDLEGDGRVELAGIDCEGTLHVFAVNAQDPRFPTLSELRSFTMAGPNASAEDLRIAPARLDADPLGELVVTVRGQAPEDDWVYAVWNLAVGEATPVRAQALCAIEADGDELHEIAVLSQSGVHISHGQGSVALGEPVVSSVAGRSMATADVDGDGLDDIVIGDGERLHVLLATSHLEGSAPE